MVPEGCLSLSRMGRWQQAGRQATRQEAERTKSKHHAPLEISKPTPSDILSPERPNLLPFPVTNWGLGIQIFKTKVPHLNYHSLTKWEENHVWD